MAVSLVYVHFGGGYSDLENMAPCQRAVAHRTGLQTGVVSVGYHPSNSSTLPKVPGILHAYDIQYWPPRLTLAGTNLTCGVYYRPPVMASALLTWWETSVHLRRSELTVVTEIMACSVCSVSRVAQCNVIMLLKSWQSGMKARFLKKLLVNKNNNVLWNQTVYTGLRPKKMAVLFPITRAPLSEWRDPKSFISTLFSAKCKHLATPLSLQ